MERDPVAFQHSRSSRLRKYVGRVVVSRNRCNGNHAVPRAIDNVLRQHVECFRTRAEPADRGASAEHCSRVVTVEWCRRNLRNTEEVEQHAFVLEFSAPLGCVVLFGMVGGEANTP